jgi:hypothetical protein
MSILKTAVVFRIYAVVSVYNTHLVYVAVSLQHMWGRFVVRCLCCVRCWDVVLCVSLWTIRFEEHGTINVRRSRRGRKMSTKRQKLLRNKENVIRFNQSFGNHCKSVAVSKTITQMMLTNLRNVLSCSNERKFSWTYSPNKFFFHESK